MKFAGSALVLELAVLLIPLNDGSSLFSFALDAGFPLRAKVAYLLTLLSQAAVIVIGLMLLRGGRASMAWGVFLSLLVILGVRVTYSVLTSING